MYSKTSIRHRLGPLTGLWALHTTVQGETGTCYFFRMGELFYQAKLAKLHLGLYLCQVEGLPEDVEALDPPVPKGTAIQAVALEEYKDPAGVRRSVLCLKLDAAACLRFELDDDSIGVAMAFEKESDTSAAEDAPVPVKTMEVEMCGFDAPAIPLPPAVLRSRQLVMLVGFIAFVGSFAAAYLLDVDRMSWLVVTIASIAMGMMLGAVRFAWRFRCPYCGKARMRPRVNMHTFVCPHCGGICRPAGD